MKSNDATSESTVREIEAGPNAAKWKNFAEEALVYVSESAAKKPAKKPAKKKAAKK